MSQDKTWDQFSLGAAPPEEKKDEPGLKPSQGGDIGGVDADVLAQWLTSLPEGESLLAPTAVAAQSVPGSAADLSQLWPPAAPVDPFANLGGADVPAAAPSWDLNFEVKPAAPPPPSFESTPAPAPAPPIVPPPAAPAAPPDTGIGLSDFALDVSGLGGPAPVMPPPAPTPPPPSTEKPFGPPPPPVAPPQEALEAPPLKLKVSIGRRTLDLTVKGEALIGRVDTTRGIHPEVDLRQDDAVSRRHAKIFVRNGRYVVTDLNSTNGTRHNNVWLQPEVEVPLATGDEIEVGEISLIKIVEAPEANA